jgi:hypothetical protein
MMVLSTDEPENFAWKLIIDAWCFLGETMYADLMNVHTRFLHIYMWKLKIPLKIFMGSIVGK